MNPSPLKDLKNRLDFFLRSHLTWGRPISPSTKLHPQAKRFQTELTEFLKAFSWQNYLTPSQLQKLTIADVGTRTFSSVLSFEEVFQLQTQSLELHGFEIDAYRRFTNFRTRADYGKYYAARVKAGYFHAVDFTTWSGHFDLIAMLHPFVTPEPLQAWGLPLKEFKPQLLFDHAAKNLLPSQGLLLLSSPNDDEFQKSLQLANNSGFWLLEKRQWAPQKGSLQKQPRLGALLRAEMSRKEEPGLIRKAPANEEVAR
jgi:hypothetical protein